MPSIISFSKTVWLMRTRIRIDAGNHISDTNASTAFPLFTLIGTLAKSMAKRSVLSSMMVRDFFRLVENLLPELAKQAST